MKRKIWIGIGVLAVVLLILSFFFLYRPAPTREQLLKKFEEFEGKSHEMKEIGYNVTEAEELARIAREFFNKKDYRRAEEMLNKAFDALKRAKVYIPEEVKEEARRRLSQVKVAIVYERVTDGALINRSIKDVINILRDTQTDFIFRGWWRFHPCPESPTESSNFFNEKQLRLAAEKGYTYKDLKEAIAEIKKEMPNVIFCGAVPAQFLHRKERNPITGEIFNENETQNMVLDPSKWGINEQPITRPKGTYYPDITNPEFQELLLSWAKKQIDCGVDAIWIDMLFNQAEILKEMTGNPYHEAVKESYEAALRIVDEIHNYGYSKYGKYIYVGTWAYPTLSLPYTPPELDFVTASPSAQEIMQNRLNNEKWELIIKAVKEKLGNVPIISFIDWAGTTGAPLGVFSQRLSKKEQRSFLLNAAKYFHEKGIIFAYPVHGGFMGEDAKTLSFGKLKIYDSLASEFQTYEIMQKIIYMGKENKKKQG